MFTRRSSPRQAFTIVEIAIVLAILGLLAGGILVGQSLIRASQLHSIPTEFTKYTAAAQSFKLKYAALPGDMPYATKLWGVAAAVNCATTTTGDEKTCDGNGNGIIEIGYPGSNEVFRFWQHLADAGMIEGSYSGISGPEHAYHNAVIGVNVPKSALTGAGFTLNPFIIGAIGPQYFFQEQANMYNYGSVYRIDATHAASTYAPALTPEEAKKIDEKVDDGKPGYGDITTFTKTNNGDLNAAINPGCATSDVASTALYDTLSDAILCSLVINSGI